MPLPQEICGRYDLLNIDPEYITSATEKLIKEQRQNYDEIAVLPLESINYDTVIQRVADLMCVRSNVGSPLYFPRTVAVSKEIRDASFVTNKKLEEFDVEVSMRKDIFEKIVAFKEKCNFDDLSVEQQRFVDRLILIGRRNGLHLTADVQTQLNEIKKKIAELRVEFCRNVDEDDTKLYFAEDQLIGLPDDFIQDLKKVEGGKLEVTLKYPHLFPISKKCSNPLTRKEVIAASQAMCIKENTLILEEIIKLRHKFANLLGYPDHASYKLEERMAKSPETVRTFLSDLVNKFQVLWEQEKKKMLNLKEQEYKKFGYEYDGILNLWDIRYYMNTIEEREYGIDHNEFRVNDSSSGELRGYFFLDLHPRTGKYGHAHIDILQPTCIYSGKRQAAVCAMLCNFTKPTKDKPSLLDHSEVETYFHEFGHVMHLMCIDTAFSMFSELCMETDFIEAPSQMLENWVWEKEPLELMSCHYETGKSLPDELIEKLALSRKANAGVFNLRQIILGTFDQRIHSSASADTSKLFSEVYQEILGISPIPNTNMAASFQHIVESYDAQYYSYLWSEVFSMDMFQSKFKKLGMLNAAVGREYRKKILSPGGSKDAMDLLVDFLGREPSSEAFLLSKGL